MRSSLTQECVGLIREDQQVVTKERTALHIGSGSLGVYATPAMLAFVEVTCRDLLDDLLDQTQSSVGTSVELKHLAPTPEGEMVNVRVEIVSIDGSLVNFEIRLWDKIEKIGEARHTRAVIDVQRFMKRVDKKVSSSQAS
jgi:fluoroacetyl-CoA thioesterase